jgi:hypothetical protein
VTPPRPTVTGRAVAARPPIHLLAAIVSLLVVSACIGGERDAGVTPSASIPSQRPSAPSPAASPTLQPSPSASPTVVPTESATPTETPVEEPTPTLAPAEAVAACAGNDANRAFYLDASENLDWPVYCPVLPARWVVATGSYSGRGVGLLEISYNGPSGATLALQQGAFCETSDGCVPAGTDAGEAAFGDQTGTLVTLDDGGYAIVVGRADTPSWLVVATGIDEATFRSFAEALVRLD